MASYGFMNLVLLLFLNTGLTLKITSSGPLELFQHCAGHGIYVVTKLLHTTDVGNYRTIKQLAQLLRHKRLPFDYVYEFGCDEHITRERVREFASVISKYSADELNKDLLLPINCIKPRTIDFESFSPGHYFSKFPSDTKTLPAMKSRQFLWHLKEARMRSGLIQNCNWLFQQGIPKALYCDPPRTVFGDSHAWSSIHHSCYIIDRTRIAGDIKIALLMGNLLREVPLIVLNLNKDDVPELTRWCLHLSLIMLNLRAYHTSIFSHEVTFDRQSDYLNRSGAIPIRDYLDSIESRIARHLGQQETNPVRISQFELLRKLLLTTSALYVNSNLIELYEEEPKLKRGPKEFTATLGLLLSGLNKNADFSRWALCILELYLFIDPQFWSVESNAADLFILHFEQATPLEQYNWIKLYIKAKDEDRSTLDFATGSVILAVQRNDAIATRVLRELSFSNPRQLGFLLYSIPYDRRLKEVRCRHLSDRHVQRRVFQLQANYALNKRLPSISKAVSYQLLWFMEGGLLYKDMEGLSKFRPVADSSLPFLSLILSLMAIYQFRWPINLDVNQVALLLARNPFSPILDIDLNDNDLQEPLEQARSTALRVLPRLLSIDEILPLILSKPHHLR